MAKKTLSVYVNLQDEELALPDYLQDKLFIISICPASITSKKFSRGVKQVKQALERGCLLGQRGLVGRCRYSHENGTDPWHENLCLDLDNPRISLDEQYEFMAKGKEILTEIFRAPVVYCPINHLWDDDTVRAAAELNYSYMMDQNHTNLPLYERQGLVIIPEAKIATPFIPASQGIYCRADNFSSRLLAYFLQRVLKRVELVLPNQIPAEQVSQRDLTRNAIKKQIHKLRRDLKQI